MPGPLALAAPYLISAGAPIVASLVGKLFGGDNQDAIDPETKKQMQLQTAAMQARAGDLESLRAGLGREGDIPRLFLAGQGGSTAKFNKSMDAFLEAADFTLARDQSLLKSLLQLNPAASPSGATAGGQGLNFAANQKATGSLATTLADIGGDILAKKTAGGENKALADAIAGAGAAAPGAVGGAGTGLFDFGDLIDNIDFGGK